jgi:CheY-like chemotaxis protein
MGVHSRLQGLSVLVVEDEAMIAVLIETILREAGCSIVGPVASSGNALEKIAHEKLDAALLDVRIDGDDAYTVADTLTARGIPFVFVSGFDQKDIPAIYRRCAHVAKPFRPDSILTCLDEIVGKPD